MINFKRILFTMIVSGIFSSVVFATCPTLNIYGNTCTVTSSSTYEGREYCEYSCPGDIKASLSHPEGATEDNHITE